jgi:GTP cyclohydrolase II
MKSPSISHICERGHAKQSLIQYGYGWQIILNNLTIYQLLSSSLYKKENLSAQNDYDNSTNPPTGPVLVRVHSECLTGDAFASLKCDCGPQLQATQKLINEAGQGVILYLRQEGRGIGLTNKIRAYALQDQGHDTVDANLLLNLPADARRYDMCSIMLDRLKVKEVKLITNNPLKIQALKDQGINVVGRVPLTVGRNPFNEQYLKTKRERMDHLYQKDDF